MLSRSNFYPYQETLEAYILDPTRRGVGLDVKMGGGKTGVTLSAIDILKRHGQCNKALVVSTVSNVLATWPIQMEKWAFSKDFTFHTLRDPDNKGIKSYVDTQWAKRKDKLLESWGKKYSPAKVEALTKEWRKTWIARHKARWYRAQSQKVSDIHLINAENFHHLCAEMTPEHWTYDLVVFDESTLFASHSSNRFKIYKKIAHLAKKVILLSGSMFSRGIEGVWSQVYLLDNGKRLGRNITEFRERYCTQGRHENVWLPQPDAVARIKAAISDCCIHIDPTEHLNTNQEIHKTVYVNLPAKYQKMLKTLERELYAILDSGEAIEPAHRADMVNKLRQLCNGFIYQDDNGERTTKFVHDAKLKALDSLVNELNSNVIINYEFQADKQRLMEHYPNAVVFDKKRATVEAWNNGEIAMLLLSPFSAAHGLDLQHGGHHMIWYNIIWSLELTEQVEARMGKVRQAQSGYNRPSFYFKLMDDSGVEDRVIKRLLELMDFQTEMHDALALST